MSEGGDPMAAEGVDIMTRISNGEFKQATTEYVEKIRVQVTEACEELIGLGARIRPLFVGKEQVGWVRGIHPAERKILDRWVYDQDKLVICLLELATTFTPEELEKFTGVEIRSLLNIVRKMTEYDISLFPYLAAYVSTMSSENLWHAKGSRLSSFENRVVSLPDGKQMKILVPPDHAGLWATLCTYREQAKKRLDENFNAVLIIRPWAGKNAEPIAAELRTLARAMATNSVEPWQNVVQIVRADVDYNDGWAHPGDSIEDLQREMNGFIKGVDKHERYMEKVYKQMRDQAEKRVRKLEALVQKRGGPGITSGAPIILTEAEVRERELKLKEGRPAYRPPSHAERELEVTPNDRIQRYR
jgi:hypothetical protein